MRRLYILFVFVIIISSCGDDSSSSSDTSFRIKTGSLTKFESPSAVSYVNGNPYNYAIIYSGAISGTNYVSIAVSNSPKYPENLTAETYNLKIYFPANSISSGTYSATTVINGGAALSESLPLTITLNTTLTTSKYNVYDINGTSPNAGLLDITAVQTQ